MAWPSRKSRRSGALRLPNLGAPGLAQGTAGLSREIWRKGWGLVPHGVLTKVCGGEHTSSWPGLSVKIQAMASGPGRLLCEGM